MRRCARPPEWSGRLPRAFEGSRVMPVGSREIAAALPYLRRYARALTGNQGIGDQYVRIMLEMIVEDPSHRRGAVCCAWRIEDTIMAPITTMENTMT